MFRFQHQSNNDVIGAPRGMGSDECSALPVTRIQYADGTHAVVSFWRPTEEEIALIRQGRPVRLITLGQIIAPVALGVDGDGLL